MFGRLLLYMLSYFGVMAIGPALFVLAVFVFKLNADNLFAQHPFGVCLTTALYMGFVVVMFFYLQDIFIKYKPASGITPISEAELVNRLEKAFDSPVNGKKLFDFMKEQNRVVITWSSSIDYFQITSGGRTGKKRVVVLTLDGKKGEVFFIMKDKDWQWKVSQNSVDLSLKYSTGIFAEFSTEYHPSIELSEDGRLKIDMKKLAYDSDDLWLPIQKTVLSSGWTLRGGMIPSVLARMVLATFFALLVFFLLYPLMRYGSTQEKNVSPIVAGDRDSQGDAGAQLERMIPNLTTETIQRQLEDIMKTARKPLHPYLRTAFATYANGYVKRKDRNVEFEAKLRSFAAEYDISRVKQ